MVVVASIFSHFKLPKAATWFYFSLLLALALFFKFSRLLSMRNWDVLTVFLLVPGLLLLQESRIQLATQAAGHLAWTSQVTMAQGLGTASIGPHALAAHPSLLWPTRLSCFAQLWFMCGCRYLLTSAVIGLGSRPARPR